MHLIALSKIWGEVHFLRTKRRTLAPYIFYYSISDGKIFVGNAVRGYEIWVYDFDGMMIRKIKKEYKRGDMDEYKKKVIETIPPDAILKEKPDFPHHLPPFQTFFSDDEGRLFVMTFNKGESNEEYLIDIFNRDGVFIGRTNLKFLLTEYAPHPMFTYLKVRKGRLYSQEKKKSGYKELVVYTMKWE
jgi:hypothetical protein